MKKLVRLLKFATFYLERYSSGTDFMGTVIAHKKILRICKPIIRVKNQLFKTYAIKLKAERAYAKNPVDSLTLFKFIKRSLFQETVLISFNRDYLVYK